MSSSERRAGPTGPLFDNVKALTTAVLKAAANKAFAGERKVDVWKSMGALLAECNHPKPSAGNYQRIENQLARLTTRLENTTANWPLNGPDWQRPLTKIMWQAQTPAVSDEEIDNTVTLAILEALRDAAAACKDPKFKALSGFDVRSVFKNLPSQVEQATAAGLESSGPKKLPWMATTEGVVEREDEADSFGSVNAAFVRSLAREFRNHSAPATTPRRSEPLAANNAAQAQLLQMMERSASRHLAEQVASSPGLTRLVLTYAAMKMAGIDADPFVQRAAHWLRINDNRFTDPALTISKSIERTVRLGQPPERVRVELDRAAMAVSRPGRDRGREGPSRGMHL